MNRRTHERLNDPTFRVIVLETTPYFEKQKTKPPMSPEVRHIVARLNDMVPTLNGHLYHMALKEIESHYAKEPR